VPDVAKCVQPAGFLWGTLVHYDTPESEPNEAPSAIALATRLRRAQLTSANSSITKLSPGAGEIFDLAKVNRFRLRYDFSGRGCVA